MTFLLQLIVAGAATGSVYALIALGVVLIYKCSGVVNFAQGAFVALGAYLTYAYSSLGLPAAVALAPAVLTMALIGAGVERLVLRPMLKAPLVAVMMATLGVLIVIRACCLMIWGPDPIAFPHLFPDGAVQVSGLFITYNYIAAGALALVLSGAFLLFYRYTRLGLMQRCSADNPRAALAIGIHTSRQVQLAWSFSAGLAGVGGALLASLSGLSLQLNDIGLIAFPVIVLGGLTSLVGAVCAGVLLGVLQTLTDGEIVPALEDFVRAHSSMQSVGALQQALPFALLVVVLFLRPQGLFGRRGTERL